MRLMRHPLDEIKQLQAWRGRRGGDPSIARLVAVAGDNAERTHRRLGQLIDLWQQLLPAQVASRTVLAGIRNGVLLVKVDSSATAFEVDRLLRGGVAAELRTRYRGTLLRVKTTVQPLDPEDQIADQVKSGRAAGSRRRKARPRSAGVAGNIRIGARRPGR